MSLFDIRPEQKLIAQKLANEIENQLIEEMAEFIQVLVKERRVMGLGQPTDITIKQIERMKAEELVDVITMIKEYLYLYAYDKAVLERIEDEKLERTMERLGIKK